MSMSKTQRTTPRTALAAARRSGMRAQVPARSKQPSLTTFVVVGVLLVGAATGILLTRKASAQNEAELPAPVKPRAAAPAVPAAPVAKASAAVPAAPAKAAPAPAAPVQAQSPAETAKTAVPENAPKAQDVPKVPVAKAKELPKVPFPSVCCSKLNEYVAGEEGQTAKAAAIYRMVSTQAVKKAGEWVVSFRVTETLKGEPQPSYRTMDVECASPKDDYNIDPQDPAGKKFVAFVDERNAFFVLTADDYAKIGKP